MRVGIVSDTHDNAPLARVAGRWFADSALDHVFHLGDVTMHVGLAPFLDLPLTVIRGNNDGVELDEALADAGRPPPLDSFAATLGGVRIGATHGHLRGAVDRLAATSDVVLHGHTHRARRERIGDALVLNPGALHRASPKTLAVLELPTLAVQFYEVRTDGVRPVAFA